MGLNPDVTHLCSHTATSWWVLSESDQQRVPAFRVPICHIFDLIWINVIRLRMYYNWKPPLQNRGSRGAPVARLELATRGLTVRCSNQLSYTGIVDSALRVWQNQVCNLLTFEY